MSTRIAYEHADSFITYPRAPNLSAKAQPIREQTVQWRCPPAHPHARVRLRKRLTAPEGVTTGLFTVTLLINMFSRWVISRRSEFSGAN